MDDRRVGLGIRALRRRRRWRQLDLAAAARVSQALVSLIERGRLTEVSVAALRQVAEALDASVPFELRWRGGQLDRLLDERHAALVEAVAATLHACGWEVRAEVSFVMFGERGSIDLVAWHAPSRTLLVIEVKSELTSVEETIRRFGTKVRVVGAVAQMQFGWHASEIARLLVLPDATTARRRVADHAATFRSVLPMSPARVRGWLRRPAGPLAAVWFLPTSNHASATSGLPGPHRVRSAVPRTTTTRAPRPARSPGNPAAG